MNVKYVYNILQNYNGEDWRIFKPTDIILEQHRFIRYNIYSNNLYELYLLSWYKKMSGFHSHPANGCLLKVMEGELYECVNINGTYKLNILKQFDMGYKDQHHKHNVIAKSQAYSIHLYSPGLKKNFFGR